MDAGRGSNVFPMPQIPELLFPPPSPPLSSSYSLSASTSRHAPTITSFPILVLTVLGILTTSVILLAYYVFVIRCCLKWHRGSSTSSDAAGHRRRQRATSSTSTTTSSLPASGAAPAEACGLDDAIIQALPAFRYRKAVKNAAADSAAAAPTSECAVCLGEFEDEEKVRMLPACLHVFHACCIDTWLQGNANCPLCRAAITSHCLLPPLDLDRPRRPEPGEVVIQVVPTTGTEEDEQAMRAQQQQQQQASTAMTSYESAGDTNTTDQQVSSDKRKSNNAWRDIDISSKADECVTDRDVLPLRRSFSTGEMAGGEVHLQIQSILQRNTHFHGDDGDSCSNSSSA